MLPNQSFFFYLEGDHLFLQFAKSAFKFKTLEWFFVQFRLLNGNYRPIFYLSNFLDRSTFSWVSKWRSFLKVFVRQFVACSRGVNSKLKLVGLGYKFFTRFNIAIMKLGYSYIIKRVFPLHFYIRRKRKKIISIYSTSYEELIKLVYQIRRLKLPDAYKAKGFRFRKELVKKKVGKKSQF